VIILNLKLIHYIY